MNAIVPSGEIFQWILMAGCIFAFASAIWSCGDEIEDFRRRIKELERRTYGDGK